MVVEAQHHSDVLTAVEAVKYLRLDVACPTMEAARRLLDRLCHDQRIAPLQWGKERLYSRRNLDDFVAVEIEALPSPSVADSDGEPPSQADSGDSGVDGHRDGHTNTT